MRLIKPNLICNGSNLKRKREHRRGMEVVDVTWKPRPKRTSRRPRTWSQAPSPISEEDPPAVAQGSSSTVSDDSPAPSRCNECRQETGMEHKYEYLDHTADVQIHSWGGTLQEAFAQAAVGMFGYMTDLDRVEMHKEIAFESAGHDMESSLFSFLNECLYEFGGDGFIMKKVEVVKLDRKHWKVYAKAWGEVFDRQKHTQGTEVKAITYSNLKIVENNQDAEKKAEIFVIVDI